MSNLTQPTLEEFLKNRHGDDAPQNDAVFSNDPRLLIQGPAGFGKTKVMVARMTRMMAIGKIPYPKRILLLTFSVNAALKARQELFELIGGRNSSLDKASKISERTFVTNYHGFCRHLLRRNGQALSTNFLDFENFTTISDEKLAQVQDVTRSLNSDEFGIIRDFNKSIKEASFSETKRLFSKFVDIQLSKLVPLSIITFNGIIALAIKLLYLNKSLSGFYRLYFPAIFIDEFQDTNVLGYWLLKTLIDDSTQLFVYGDQLQRIYGFIGAIPGILTHFRNKFDLRQIDLQKSYRFGGNPQMLQLEKNIRDLASNPQEKSFIKPVRLPLRTFRTQAEEAQGAVQWIEEHINIDPKLSLGILVKQRGPNADAITEELERRKISYFWGLFSDEEPDYSTFHNIALQKLLSISGQKSAIGRPLAQEHYKSVVKSVSNIGSKTFLALTKLLAIFWKQTFSGQLQFSAEDRFYMAEEVFTQKTLKRYMEFLETKLVVSTVHGAKGLEWDYVLLPDLEQDLFPHYLSLCKYCQMDCKSGPEISTENEVAFLDELSVFYVGVTRSRNGTAFSKSCNQLDIHKQSRMKEASCFLRLAGIVE